MVPKTTSLFYSSAQKNDINLISSHPFCKTQLMKTDNFAANQAGFPVWVYLTCIIPTSSLERNNGRPLMACDVGGR